MYVNMLNEHMSNALTPARGAAVWACVHVPVVSPEGWFILEHHDALIELERIRRELDAATALVVASMPDSRDTIANLSRKCGISNNEARRRRDVAKVVNAMPKAGELLARGEISEEHVRAMSNVLEQPGADELVGAAASMSPEDFTKHVKEFRLSNEHGEDVAKRQRSQRCLRFFDGPDGMIGLKGLLPPIEGMDLKTRLAALIDAKYRKDHPERAKTLGGHNVDPLEQRMLDALLELTGVKEFTDIVPTDLSTTRPVAPPNIQSSSATRSADARSNDARSNDARSNDARSNDARSNDARIKR
jgi:hypothetical protein